MKTEIIGIPLTSKNKGEASSVDLDSVITLCQMGENIADAGRKIKPYLARYLHALGAKTAVIENNYVDHDYLDDYSNYYAKCFDAPPRLCARVHFFSDVGFSVICGIILGCGAHYVFKTGIMDFLPLALGK